MATSYARIMNQYNFNYHILFLASFFFKINEEDQRSEEFEFFINLNFNHKYTESVIDNHDVKSQL